MAKIKMIITDLDNTLLRTDKTISDYTVRILNKCREFGIKVAFATARPVRVARYENFTPDAFIADGGAIVDCGGKIIHRIGIPNEILNALIPELKNSVKVGYLTVETGEYLLSDYKGNQIMDDLSAWNIVNTDFTEKIAVPSTKISIECKHKSWLNGLIKNYPELKIQGNTGEDWSQVYNAEVSKYKGVKILAEYFNIALDEIAAFGDDFIDIEMIRECGTGIAVANAIDEIKATADYICDTNDNDGVAKWLEEIILI
jgi:Cof subfamily protein (haloacid dehalogenase superfamily)